LNWKLWEAKLFLNSERHHFTMGQQISDQTQLVINKLPEKVAKHVTLVRESGSLTYEEFLGRVAELNDVTAKVAAGQEKHLLFEVQPGSDSSAFWKVVVRVVCTKINKRWHCGSIADHEFVPVYSAL
jgi:phage protein D